MTRLGFVDLYGVIRLTDMFEISIMPVINMLGVAALWIGYDFLTEKQLLLDRIASLSFFVYCLHWIILPWIGAITKRVLPFRRFPNFFAAGGTTPRRAQFTHWRHEKSHLS